MGRCLALTWILRTNAGPWRLTSQSADGQPAVPGACQVMRATARPAEPSSRLQGKHLPEPQARHRQEKTRSCTGRNCFSPCCRPVWTWLRTSGRSPCTKSKKIWQNVRLPCPKSIACTPAGPALTIEHTIAAATLSQTLFCQASHRQATRAGELVAGDSAARALCALSQTWPSCFTTWKMHRESRKT